MKAGGGASSDIEADNKPLLSCSVALQQLLPWQHKQHTARGSVELGQLLLHVDAGRIPVAVHAMAAISDRVRGSTECPGKSFHGASLPAKKYLHEPPPE